MYPWGMKKEEIENFLASHPEKHDEIMGLRTGVRRVTAGNVQRDLAELRQYPVLDTLHPGFKQQLLENSRKSAKAQSSSDFYAVPYSVAYADELMKAHGQKADGRRQVAGGRWREAGGRGTKESH